MESAHCLRGWCRKGLTTFTKHLDQHLNHQGREDHGPNEGNWALCERYNRQWVEWVEGLVSILYDSGLIIALSSDIWISAQTWITLDLAAALLLPALPPGQEVHWHPPASQNGDFAEGQVDCQ